MDSVSLLSGLRLKRYIADLPAPPPRCNFMATILLGAKSLGLLSCLSSLVGSLDSVDSNLIALGICWSCLGNPQMSWLWFLITRYSTQSKCLRKMTTSFLKFRQTASTFKPSLYLSKPSPRFRTVSVSLRSATHFVPAHFNLDQYLYSLPKIAEALNGTIS